MVEGVGSGRLAELIIRGVSVPRRAVLLICLLRPRRKPRVHLGKLADGILDESGFRTRDFQIGR